MKNLLIIFSIAFLFACGNKTETPNNSTYVIDVNGIKVSEPLKISSLFKGVNAIVLENDENDFI